MQILLVPLTLFRMERHAIFSPTQVTLKAVVSFLIPHLLVVFTQQLEILVTAVPTSWHFYGVASS